MPRRALFLALLAAAACGTLHAESPPTHAAAFSDDGLIKADVADLKDTQLVAHPDVPIPAKTNVIWCGTLQLAWNEAIKLVGEKLQFVHQPPLVDLLNREDFTRHDLNPDCYVAIADFERNHVEDKIRAALEQVFHGAASPELIPPVPQNPGPDDFVAYSYLYKNLRFQYPFEEDSDGGVCFYSNPNDGASASNPVKGFRFTRHGPDWGKVTRQVSIFDYRSESDFIVRIKTADTGDDLILAKVPDGATLQDRIRSVLKRMSMSTPVSPGDDDGLWVPQINYDLRGDFPSLEDLKLIPGPNARVHDMVTKEVKQLVRFQLNKEGAKLKSEAVIMMVTGAMVLNPKRHLMRFNEPFLILMKQAGAKEPYFAMWVGNASLLIPAK